MKIEDEILKLKELLDKGLLTESEFKIAKEGLFAKINSKNETDSRSVNKAAESNENKSQTKKQVRVEIERYKEKEESSKKTPLIIMLIGSLLLIIFGFISQKRPNNDKDTSNNLTPKSNVTTTSSLANTLSNGVTMKHDVTYTRYSDSSCTASDRRICISIEDYKKLCNQTRGFTENATNIFLMPEHDRIANYLLNNGSGGSLKIEWSDSSSKCFATVSVSGLFNGSQVVRRLNGNVSSFILGTDNRPLVSYAEFMYSD